MTHNFYLTRLYNRTHFEGELIPNSIVSFRKSPYEQKTHIGTTYTSKYAYGLFIDLWLIRVKLTWLGRELKEPT